MTYQWTAFSIFFLALIFAISSNACFSPFNMTVPRPQMSIMEARDKIFFIGGGIFSASSSIIDIYDAKESTWRRQIQLPDQLQQFAGAAVDSKAIFIGSNNANKTDGVFVYDIETEELWQIPTWHNFTLGPDWNSNGWGSITIGAKAYFYRDDRVVIVDVYANTSITLRGQGQNPKATTNGTHLIIVSYQLALLNLETLEWTRESLGISSPVAVFYINDTERTLAIVESNRLLLTSLDDLNGHQIITIKEPASIANRIGDTIYLVGETGVSVVYLNDLDHQYAFARAKNVFYQLGNTKIEAHRSVVYNGSIYYTSRSPGVYRMDLQWLFIEMDLQLNGSATNSNFATASNGYYFYFNMIASSIHYYQLSTGQLGIVGQRNFPATFDRDSTKTVGNKLLVLRYPEYDTFYFKSGTWNTLPMPYNASIWLPFTSDKYAVAHKLNDLTNVYLVDVAQNNWTSIEVNFLIYNGFFVQDNLVVATKTSLKIFDILTRQWHSSALPSQEITAVAQYETSLVILLTANSTTKVALYNVLTDQLMSTTIPAKVGALVETYGDFIVVADSRTTKSEIQTVRITVLNARTLSWNYVDLPPNFSDDDQVLSINNNMAYLARQERVEVVDLLTLAVSTISVPIKSPKLIYFVGNEVLFASTSQGSSVLFTIYDSTVKMSTQVQYSDVFLQDAGTRVTDNYIITKLEDKMHFLEFPTLFNAIPSASVFIGQSANFTATPTGGLFSRAYWQDKFGNQLGDGFSLSLNNVSLNAGGAYFVNIFDQCQQQMQQSAQLVVYDKPLFMSELNDVIVLCNDSAVVSQSAFGEQVQYVWTIDGTSVSRGDSTANITVNHLSCDSNHRLCVVATNPSGSSQICSFLEVVSVDTVFDGPRPSAEQLLWFSESQIDLHVQLLDPDCFNHTWLMDGVSMGVYGTQQSSITVHMSTKIESTEFQVEAVCNYNIIRSRPYKFKNVTSLTPLGLSLIILSIALVIAVPVLVSIGYRRRLNRSRQQQQDLEMRLSHAKTESIRARDNVTILQPITWEWLPTDDYTYKAIEELPFDVDFSALKFFAKNAVEVEVFVQGDITFTSKSNSKKGVKMPLLGSNHHVDIYVPKSPKYEIIAEPSSLDVSSRRPMHVTVSSKLRMTARCNICLIIVCEHDHTYSAIEFKLESTPSMWLDIEEVQMTQEFLGGGGFGSVTRGIYRGQDVAVKKLLLQSMPEEIITEFEREVSLMKSLHHPNIVQFVGASNVQNNLSIVIEFAPLGSLASVMKKQQLSHNLKLVMLLETAKALQFLHSNGIVHRDIKPQNILVFSLEPKAAVHVKLTDFGTARFIPDSATNVTRNIGTSGYMAPESLGKKPKISKSADVYSFAILMWEIIFERVPFEAMNWQSDIEEHVLSGERLPFPSSPHVQQELVQLIEDCWQQDPLSRPTITSVAQRIAAIL